LIQIYEVNSSEPAGTITEAQLQFLIDQLEEEALEDQDYYINRTILDVFEDRGADLELVALLRHMLGEREDMDIRWSKV
jgi:hypothetical protein